MAAFIEVSDPADERLADYTRLRDVNLRRRLETDRGLFLAEGEKVVRRAIEAGHTARSFLMAPRWLESLADVLATTNAPCYVLPEAEIEHVTGFHVHRGALAALDRPRPLAATDVLEAARRVVVLEDLSDHTNVGAIFRSVAALGWDAVLLSPRCADPLYRRSIKVSMGTVFRVPWARVEKWHDAPGLLRALGFTSVAMTLGEGAIDLTEVPTDRRLALIVGSEGHGLTDHWESGSLIRATIPMAAEIDSLNVAASVAIACWELRAP